MSWVAAAIAGGGALLKLGTGAIQSGQANSIDKNNPFPHQTVQPEFQQNVNQANQMAQTGTPTAQYNQQKNAIQQNQAGGLLTLSRSANPGAAVAGVVRAGDNATGALNAQDAIARNRNMLNLLQQRQILASQKDKAWDWNSKQKYLGLLAKSNALRGASNQNINGAFNDVTGVGSTMLRGQTNPYGQQGAGNGYVTQGYVNDTPIGADQSTIS